MRTAWVWGVGAAPGMGKMSTASEPRTSKSTLMPAAGAESSPCHSSRVKAYRFPSSPEDEVPGATRAQYYSLHARPPTEPPY